MVLIMRAIRLLQLLLSTITASTAQQAIHRLHPRYLAQGVETPSPAARHVANALSTPDNKLYTEYKSKLALRHAVLSIFEHLGSAQIQRRDLETPQHDKATLLEKINELETAFQSLVALLAADYGVPFSLSSETSSPTTSIPTSTLMPDSGSTIAATAAATSTVDTSTPDASTGAMASAEPSSIDVMSSPTAPPQSNKSSEMVTSSLSSSLPSATSSASSFDPMSSSNVAVYYGQTDQTSNVPLTTICADPNVDIVVLAFVTTFYTPFPTGNYPTLNMGSHCWAASSAQVSAGATGLIDCVSDGFAGLVRDCQTMYGKKVFLSLGGAIAYSDTRIPNDTMANSLADTLWDLFLGGSGLESIRPFGDVVLDGIDIDNENPANAVHLLVLISSLRQNFASASGVFYLSAAPQCPRPDQSIPLQSMQTQIDFVWTQFYNNPACNLDSDGFISSLQEWTKDLSGSHNSHFGESSTGGFVDTGNGVSSPRLLVGSPAFAKAGSGFVQGLQFKDLVAQVKNTSLGGAFHEASPLGGFMFWDGAYGEESTNVDGVGESYMQIVKETLG